MQDNVAHNVGYKVEEILATISERSGYNFREMQHYSKTCREPDKNRLGIGYLDLQIQDIAKPY